MVFSWMGRRISDSMVDSFMHTLANDKYTENLYELVSTTQKVGTSNLVETIFRAEQGKPLTRPFGSGIALSPWDRLLLSPVHLWRLPTPETVQIDTSITIGPTAEKPLKLDIPILIAGMSFGGALSEPAKVALARAATLMGTATNSGEAGLLASELREAKYFIGQYNRGGWMNTPDKLRQLSAVEIQVGQGAQASTPQRTLAKNIGPDFRRVFGLNEGEDAVIRTRLPGVDSPDDFVRLVPRLKEQAGGVPVGLKFCATHYLERELEVAVEAGVDFVCVDGHEGGTHGGSTTVQDDVGFPTLVALARTVRYLDRVGVRDRISVIASGGLRTPGHMLKALALGADAVYTGTMAVLAMVSDQMVKTVPFEPPTDLVLYSGKRKDRFDVAAGVRNLTNYLTSAVQDMKHIVMTVGKIAITQLDRTDLVALDRDLAYITGVEYAYLPPEEQWRVRGPDMIDGRADGAPAHGTAEDGAAQDGAVQDGATEGGPAKDGPVENGRTENGRPRNGTRMRTPQPV